MTQLPLFDSPTVRGLVHRNDPATSRASAIDAQQSGRITRQQQQVLALIARHPGLTSIELADYYDHRDAYHAIGRRMGELQALSLIRYGEARRPDGATKEYVTLWPTAAGIEKSNRCNNGCN